MEYRKPEMLLVSRAAEVIESNLTKDFPPPDSLDMNFPSAGSAYEADE